MFDIAVTQWVQSWRPEWLTAVFRALMWATDTAGYFVIAPVVALGFLWRGRGRLALATVLVLLITAVNPVLKLAFQRERPSPPEALVLQTADGWSFPSGHAVASFAFFGFLIFVTLRSRARHRALIIVGLAVIILLVGYGSVYLGRHWATDILAGWVVGGIWLIAYLRVARRLIR